MRKKIDQQEFETIILLHEKGLELKKIAAVCNRSESAISNCIRNKTWEAHQAWKKTIPSGADVKKRRQEEAKKNVIVLEANSVPSGDLLFNVGQLVESLRSMTQSVENIYNELYDKQKRYNMEMGYSGYDEGGN